jgi:hypothetical protein
MGMAAKLPKRIALRGLLIMAGLTLALASHGKDGCRECHLEAGDELAAPVHAMDQDDIHASRGLSCASCHGGDPEADDQDQAMSRARGFIGTPKPNEIPQFCGRCHSNPQFIRKYSVSLPTDQLEKYGTSQHGIALSKGSSEVATCISCHGIHTIHAANNPKSSIWPTNVPQTCNHCHGDAALMRKFGLEADAFKDYAEGVHGRALLEKRDTGAPACNDCHGNHGAVPPGFESVAQVCRQCHVNNAEQFMISPHKTAFDAAGLPECVACHDNHRILHPDESWLDVAGEHSCGQCHSQGDTGFAVALQIKVVVDSLRASEEKAIELVGKAERRGIQVGEALTALAEARQALLQTRTTIHTADIQKVRDSARPGFERAMAAEQMGRKGLSDFEFRKRGLGIATIFITLLIVAIWLWLKHIEGR